MCYDSEILALEDEVKNLEIKIKSIKQEYINLLNINIQKDLSIRKIKQEIKQKTVSLYQWFSRLFITTIYKLSKQSV